MTPRVRKRPPSQSASTQEVRECFRRHFGYPPVHTAQAPLSVELLGHQAAQSEGLIITVAVNRYLQVAIAPRHDGKIELVSTRHPDQPSQFWLSAIAPHAATPWADLPKAVLLELRRRGVTFAGFDAAIHSGVPPGLGLAEHASLALAMALAVRKQYPFKLMESGCLSRAPQPDRYGQLPPLTKPERLAFSKVSQASEAAVLGEVHGVSRHLGSLFSKAYHAACVDERFHHVECVPLFGEMVLVLCPSQVPAPEARSAWRQRRQHATAAARVMQAKNLRSVDLSHLAACRMKLSDDEYACAYHLVGENQRVVFALRALQEGDLVQFGQYLLQSHESARDFLRLSCPELDLLTDLAREHPGCAGARLTGEGLGGCTANLVAWNLYEDFIRHIRDRYERQTGRRSEPLVCQVVDGAD